MKTYNLSDPLYFLDLTLIIGGTDKEVKDKIEKEYPGADLSNCLDSSGYSVTLLKDGLRKEFLWVDRFDWSIKDQSSMAHEIFHLTSHVMSFAGCKFGDDSEEAYAYYYSYMFRKIWEVLSKEHPKRKKNERRTRKK